MGRPSFWADEQNARKLNRAVEQEHDQPKEVGRELWPEPETQDVEKLDQDAYGRGGIADLANDWMDYGPHIVRKTARAAYHEDGASNPKTEEEAARSPPQRRTGKAGMGKTHRKIGHEPSAEREQKDIEQAISVGWSPATRLLPESDYDSREPRQGYGELRDGCQRFLFTHGSSDRLSNGALSRVAHAADGL